MANSSPPSSNLAGSGGLAGLVLAAGSGQRFGGPKAPFVCENERLVDRSVRILHESGVATVFVVLGAWIGPVPRATVLENPDFATGMASSLRVGLEYLTAKEPQVDRVVITLVDHIGLSAEGIIELLAHQGRLIQSTYGSEIGHPVVIGREHWAALITELVGDVGAKNYLHKNNALQVSLSDFSNATDLDHRP
ncbi:MAG: NTP transferase domain-containing protein [Actinomycetales bacterium]|jgi:CTP:molybdopterin cytidylyltransferase MocA|nr:NTP transferase domain-containing protein [Actinomycetales bacterium]